MDIDLIIKSTNLTKEEIEESEKRFMKNGSLFVK